MTYEALARKWRPQVFDDIVEQKQVTQTLKNAISGGRIHHAYLFTGPRGTGKTTTARILAKALNCEAGPTPVPCNQCLTCKQITHGSHLDVLEIDAASNTGVDNIRDLREAARYVPASARYKIYIIDEIHRLSPSAFDALLKTLEEPPDSVIFIFATTEPNAVPATVRSRTLRFDFRLISQDPLRQALGRIAEAESIKIDEEALTILATEAAGSMRDGQSLLDQMAGYTGDLITGELVYEALGLVDSAILFAFTDAIAAGDPEKVLAIIGTVSKAGRDLLQFARQLTEHLKRLLFACALGDKFADESLSTDAIALYRERARNHDENDLLRLMMMTVEVAKRLKNAAQPRLEMELLAMRAARMDRSVDIRTLVEQLQGSTSGSATFGGSASMTRQTPEPTLGLNNHRSSPPPGSGGPSARMSVPSPTAASSYAVRPQSNTASTAVAEPPEAAEPQPARVKMDGAAIDFSPILDRICQARPTLQAILGQAQLVKTGAGTVDLNVYKGSTFHQRQLAQKPIRDLIHAEIARALGEGLRVTIHVKSEEQPGSGNGSPQRKQGTPQNGALAADHNLQEILRRFDGEIAG